MRSLVLLFALPVLAQTGPADLPIEGSIRGRAVRSAVVVAEFAEVRAGPGAAYISRGRAYQGDVAEARRRNEAGDWIEVSVGGLRGWVRARALRFGEASAPRGADGAVDAGRDRRQTNYRYDAEGRRLRPDGSRAGSAGSRVEAPAAPAGASTIRLSLHLGASRVGRRFRSNIEPASALDVLEASPVGLATTLGASWAPNPWLELRGLFRDSRLGSVTLPAQPEAGFDRAVSLAVEAQQVELDAVGGLPLGPAWLGGYLGCRLLRHGFQETAPYPVFLTSTYLGLGVGAQAQATFGRVALSARGGAVVVLAASQEPVASGEADGSGLEGGLEVAVRLGPSVEVVAHGHYQALITDLTGEADHRDTVNDLTYTVAREEDDVIGGGLGVRWSP